MLKVIKERKKDNYLIGMLTEFWKIVNDVETKKAVRDTLFDFYFEDFEDYDFRMTKRVVFLQIIRDPKITFAE